MDPYPTLCQCPPPPSTDVYDTPSADAKDPQEVKSFVK